MRREFLMFKRHVAASAETEAEQEQDKEQEQEKTRVKGRVVLEAFALAREFRRFAPAPAWVYNIDPGGTPWRPGRCSGRVSRLREGS